MSKYRVGDVVIAPVAYFDDKKGYYVSQNRRFIIVKIEDNPDEIDCQNITVSCTGQVHQADKYPGITIAQSSKEGIEMQLTMDTFVYCNKTTSYSDKEIIRRKGHCARIDEILKLVQL